MFLIINELYSYEYEYDRRVLIVVQRALLDPPTTLESKIIKLKAILFGENSVREQY